uniref:Bm10160 n=1 Tax=Brugia malayi TaxID=6279 RepID=A0A1I9G0F2_BRUMA|nr:Bm10160 [Brugia malayi]
MASENNTGSNRDDQNATQIQPMKKWKSVSDIYEPRRLTVTLSEGTLSLPHRLVCNETIGVLEENEKLKAELFNLKIQLLLYIDAMIELNNARNERIRLEKMCYAHEKKLNEQRRKMRRERIIHKKERRNLLKQKGILKSKLKNTLQKLLELDDKYDKHMSPIPNKDTKTEELKLRLSLTNLILEEGNLTPCEITEQTGKDEDARRRIIKNQV